MRKTLISFAASMLLLGASAAYANGQVKWDPVSPVAPWYLNQELESALHKSVDQFFGTAVGAYFTNSYTAPFKKFAENTKWQRISSQFYGPPGTFIQPAKGTILNGQWKLYAYEESGSPLSAFVTPIDSTKIVAAMIVHQDCPPIPRQDITDAAAVKAHFTHPQCGKEGEISVFFKNKFSVNRQIQHMLLTWTAEPIIKQCKHDILHNPDTGEHKAWIAMYGAVPRCHVNWNIVLLDREQQ